MKRAFALALVTASLAVPAFVLPSAPVEAHQLRSLTMQPSQSEIVRLPRDAASVIVANPAHLTAVLDQPDILVLIPNTPGRTSIIVLDEEGRSLYSRMVTVRTGRGTVNVVRNCTDGAGDCAPVETLDCAPNCVSITYPEAATPGDVTITESQSQVEMEPPQEPLP
ncbi:MAG: hypothetical protein Alpg2KO_17390 [Alphaproteobacteria bacterium]